MIYLGADHRGYELKEKAKQWLVDLGYQFEDMGAFEYNKDDDYPDFVVKVAQKVSEDPENNKGIVFGMSGQGEAIVANKFKGVRATVFYGPPFAFWSSFLAVPFLADQNWAGVYRKIIKLSKEHNNANVLSLGASFVYKHLVKKVIKIWLETKFSGEERHKRRIEKIDNL